MSGGFGLGGDCYVNGGGFKVGVRKMRKFFLG